MEVEIPIPLATATIAATLDDGSGNPPVNVIHEDDAASVEIDLDLVGVTWDFSELDWEFTLRIEGNPRAPATAGQNVVLGPVTVSHNGTPGTSPYNYSATIPIPPGTITVAPEKAQSAEFTLEVVGVDDASGDPHGMAGFVDIGEVMVYVAP